MRSVTNNVSLKLFIGRYIKKSLTTSIERFLEFYITEPILKLVALSENRIVANNRYSVSCKVIKLFSVSTGKECDLFYHLFHYPRYVKLSSVIYQALIGHSFPSK